MIDNFVEDFKKVLEEFRTTYQINTVIDLFGGSGLLSHTVKRMYPEMKVIYNDYDDFHTRLACIQVTNSLLTQLSEIAGQKVKVELNMVR